MENLKIFIICCFVAAIIVVLTFTIAFFVEITMGKKLRKAKPENSGDDEEEIDLDANNLVKINENPEKYFILTEKGTTDKINFSKDKTIVSVTTICFDIFVLESYLPLQKGLTIVLANEKEQNDIKLLKSCLKYEDYYSILEYITIIIEKYTGNEKEFLNEIIKNIKIGNYQKVKELLEKY